MTRALLPGLAAAALLGHAAPALAQEAPPPTGRRLTLGQAVKTALEQSPDLAISSKGVDAARSRLRASKARRLPTLSLEAQALYWNDELAFGFELPPGMEPPPGTETGGDVVVRDQITTSTSVTLTQPLSHQIVIGRLVAAERHGLRAAEHDHAARRLQAATDAASAYLGVLLAQATSEISRTRIALVEAQLARARVLQEGGVLGKVDVMRLEAALAGARREAIQAAATAASAEDQLVFLLGLPDGTDLELVDDLPAAGEAPPLDADQAVQQALGRRPDLAAARARADAARAGAAVQKAELLPSLVALGTYQHNTGGGEFQPEHAWFVGLALSWNVWDWGTTRNNHRAASHQADQAALSADRAADGMRLEVRRAAREVRAAHEALEVARVGLAAAEEAFRIQEVRFGEGAATTTDLLAAEVEVSQSRTNHATARIAYFASLTTLARATGQLPDALLPAARSTPTSGTP